MHFVSFSDVLSPVVNLKSCFAVSVIPLGFHALFRSICHFSRIPCIVSQYLSFLSDSMHCFAVSVISSWIPDIALYFLLFLLDYKYYFTVSVILLDRRHCFTVSVISLGFQALLRSFRRLPWTPENALHFLSLIYGKYFRTFHRLHYTQYFEKRKDLFILILQFGKLPHRFPRFCTRSGSPQFR